MLRQAVIVFVLGLRSLGSRAWQSLVIVFGMACVIGVLLSLLSLSEGMAGAWRADFDARDAIVVARNAQWENSGNIPIGQARILANAPGIARGGDGAPLVDFSFITGVPGVSAVDGSRSYMPIRGIGPRGVALRNVHLTAGRMFRPGSHELIAGERMPDVLKYTGLGDKVIMPDGEWSIVGIFTAPGQLKGTLLGDAETVMGTLRRHTYHSALVRLETPAAYPAFRRAVMINPALSVDVYDPPAWGAKTSSDFRTFFLRLVYGISLILAVGALFGCVNTMYASVESRRLEIATLRALGYGGAAVAFSVLLEAALLTAAGALLGATIAWAFYDGHYAVTMGVTLTVSAAMVGMALLWALGVALLGGILPSIRAARWTVSEALRAR
jgi:putative ABC transport system permease protein